MPSKLLVNLATLSHQSTVAIQEDDGPAVQLRRVKRITLTADVDDTSVPLVELTMYSSDFQGEVTISDLTSEAIVMHERQRQLSFLDDRDLGHLRELFAILVNVRGWPDDDPRLAPLKKIIAILEDRREIIR